MGIRTVFREPSPVRVVCVDQFVVLRLLRGALPGAVWLLAADYRVGRAQIPRVRGCQARLRPRLPVPHGRQVRCPKCREEFLVPYSCRGRCFCPSCHQKRALEKAGWRAATHRQAAHFCRCPSSPPSLSSSSGNRRSSRCCSGRARSPRKSWPLGALLRVVFEQDAGPAGPTASAGQRWGRHPCPLPYGAGGPPRLGGAHPAGG